MTVLIVTRSYWLWYFSSVVFAKNYRSFSQDCTSISILECLKVQRCVFASSWTDPVLVSPSWVRCGRRHLSCKNGAALCRVKPRRKSRSQLQLRQRRKQSARALYLAGGKRLELNRAVTAGSWHHCQAQSCPKVGLLVASSSFDSSPI